MRIESFFSNIISNSIDKNLFKEGDTIEGKILDILDNTIIIEFKDLGTISANMEGQIELSINDKISFLVKSANNSLLELKPLLSEEISNEIYTGKESLASKILEKFNLSVSKESLTMVESLMKFNIPLSEENILKALKIYDKLDSLTNLKADEKIVLLDENPIENAAFSNSKNPLNNEVSNLKNLDIKYLLLSKSDELVNQKDMSKVVKILSSNLMKVENQDKLIKITSFLIKNNIKPSLDNIESLLELDNNPLEFLGEIRNIYKTLFKSGTNNILQAKEGNGRLNNDNILFKKEIHLSQMKELLKDPSISTSIKSNDEYISINDKILFLEDLSKNYSFIFLPMSYFNDETNSILTIIKEKRKKGNLQENLYIYLNVETKNLGNVKVNCQLKADYLYIQMHIKEEDLELFESSKKLLIEKISSLGYSLKGIKFNFKEDDGLINSLTFNSNPIYLLDVEV